MKVLNTTDKWSTSFLRRMTIWIRKELDLEAKHLREAKFTKCKKVFRGRAWWTRILVRVNPDFAKYPFVRTPYKKGAPEYVLNDVLETLVVITAHEVEHIRQYWQTRLRKGNRKHFEAHTERTAVSILKSFRMQREGLLADWTALDPKQEPATILPMDNLMPKPQRDMTAIVEKRRLKVMSDLKRWERKLKLAKTKVAKLRIKLRYYEKKQSPLASAAGKS